LSPSERKPKRRVGLDYFHLVARIVSVGRKPVMVQAPYLAFCPQGLFFVGLSEVQFFLFPPLFCRSGVMVSTLNTFGRFFVCWVKPSGR
jgi:hypothetical protein